MHSAQQCCGSHNYILYLQAELLIPLFLYREALQFLHALFLTVRQISVPVSGETAELHIS